MQLFIRLFLVALFVLGFTGGTFGQISNGCFELMDPCELVDPCVYRPAMWASENYVAIHSSFAAYPAEGTPMTEYAGWGIMDPNATLRPFEGQYYALLSTGDPGIFYAKMTQDVNFVEGQTVEFYYFFGTMDYDPYNDFAMVNLHEIDPNGRIWNSQQILTVSLSDVGDHNCTPGWIKVSYYLDPNDPNEYNQIEFNVQDVGDSSFKSYFAIDGLKLGYKPASPTGNFNDDWMVDFKDFAIFSEHWNQDVNDPNWYSSADFDDTNSVDVNDLMIFSSYWLDGEPNICSH